MSLRGGELGAVDCSQAEVAEGYNLRYGGIDTCRPSPPRRRGQ